MYSVFAVYYKTDFDQQSDCSEPHVYLNKDSNPPRFHMPDKLLYFYIFNKPFQSTVAFLQFKEIHGHLKTKNIIKYKCIFVNIRLAVTRDNISNCMTIGRVKVFFIKKIIKCKHFE